MFLSKEGKVLKPEPSLQWAPEFRSEVWRHEGALLVFRVHRDPTEHRCPQNINTLSTDQSLSNISTLQHGVVIYKGYTEKESCIWAVKKWGKKTHDILNNFTIFLVGLKQL